MSLRLPHSLQGRLLVWVLGTVTAVWLAAAAVTWFDVRHELDELLDGHLAQAAALLVVQQAPGPDDDDDEHAPRVDAPTLHRYAPKVAFQVFHEGRLTMRSANAPVTPMVGSAGPFRSGFRTVTLGDKAWRVFATFGAERDVQVYVGEQVDSRTGILLAVLRNTLMPLLWALPLLAVVAWWAVRQGTAPLRRLGATLGTRQAQALHPVVVPDAPSEMAPMVAALNGLFERITALMDSERRFTADASHELRTPIAAIRTQAQVALGAEDDASRQHALEATIEGCDRARRLVEQLLTLSRLEAGHAPPPGLVDLAALTRQELAQIAPRALARGQTLELDAPAPCPVRGDATLVAVLVRNLVDNAVRYSLPSSQIHVAVHVAPDQARLTVEDSGPGLDDASRARLGERFFRVLGSGQAGSGLGWSIVRRIAAAQGAQVQTATSARLGGMAVTVCWPATADASPASAA